MTAELEQALTITGLGLVLTFAANGLFILTISVLRWLCPAPPEHGLEPAFAPAPEPHRELAEVAVAVAVALARLRRSGSDTLGRCLETGRGAWWHAGRLTDARDWTVRRSG